MKYEKLLYNTEKQTNEQNLKITVIIICTFMASQKSGSNKFMNLFPIYIHNSDQFNFGILNK